VRCHHYHNHDADADSDDVSRSGYEYSYITEEGVRHTCLEESKRDVILYAVISLRLRGALFLKLNQRRQMHMSMSNHAQPMPMYVVSMSTS
jgi:hypothetical protein